MNDYKLYKGAWVYQGKPQEEVRLTSQQIQEFETALTNVKKKRQGLGSQIEEVTGGYLDDTKIE